MSVMITHRDVERFTEGDCHVLAKRIHRLTGWPLVAFSHKGYGPTTHIGVKMPNGCILDIEGMYTPKEWRAKWKKYISTNSCIMETTLDALREWGGPAFGHYSYRRARQVAPQLLHEVGVKVSV